MVLLCMVKKIYILYVDILKGVGKYMKKRLIMIACIAMLISLCGCGNTDKLDEYYDGMTAFNGNIQIITETLELIDVEKESAASQVCDQLDKLVEQFRIMSELNVPKDFSACEELGDDAYTYIKEATNLYKEWAQDPENADSQLVDMAKQNYDRAMTRVNYISIILQGDIPQGDGVSVTEEEVTDFDPFNEDDEQEDYVPVIEEEIE